MSGRPPSGPSKLDMLREKDLAKRKKVAGAMVSTDNNDAGIAAPLPMQHSTMQTQSQPASTMAVPSQAVSSGNSRPSSRDSQNANNNDASSEDEGAQVNVTEVGGGGGGGLFREGVTATQREMELRGITGAFDGTREEPVETINWENVREAIHTIIPRRTLIQCRIEREKRGFGRNYVYHVYLSDTNQFLMSARKRSKKSSSNYIISLNKVSIERENADFVGKVRANFLGTEFTIFDNGVSAKKATPQDQKRQELGCVLYNTNIFGTQGPRKMQIIIPCILPTGQRRIFRPETDKETLLETFKTSHHEDLFLFKNKAPVWNEQSRAYVLNFNGRVTRASVKNFQMIPDTSSLTDDSAVVLQFGKTNKDAFNMDVRWPLTLFQAFGIVLTSFDGKLACE